MSSVSTKPTKAGPKKATADNTIPAEKLAAETKDQRQWLNELFMQAPALIVVLKGPDHVFELANPLYRKLVGKQWNIIGKPVREALPFMEEKFIKLLDKVYQTGKPFVGKEMPAKIDRKGNGEYEEIYFNFVYQPYRDSSGQVQGIFAHGVDVTEQVLARKKAEESEEYFRASFDQSAVGIAHTAVDGKWLRVNQKLCDMLGYDKSELLSKKFQDFTHPDDLAASLKALRKLTRDKLPTYAFEKRYIKKDGTTVWANLTISTLRDSKGKIKHFISVIENITKRKKAEEDVKESEARFRATFDQAAVAMSIVGLDGKWIRLNAAYIKTFGYSEKELAQIDFVKLTHPSDRASDKQAVAKLLKGEINKYIKEKRYLHKNGSIVWGMAHAALVKNDEGVPQYFVTAIQDVTARKHMEETLQISETRYRTMIEQSPLSTQILSPDGRTLQVNKAWEKLWGAKLEHLKDYNMLKDKQLIDLGIMPYIKKGFKGKPTFIPAVRYEPNKTIAGVNAVPYRWVQAYIYPVKASKGSISEVVLVHEDITDSKQHEDNMHQANDLLKEQQKELEILNQSKDDFIALASHQLRTPATAIKQLLGLFVEGLQPISEDHLYIIKKAYKSNERQLKIVNSLLKVAQVDSGRIVLRKKDTDIVILLENIVEELHETFAARNQTINFPATPAGLSVLADKQYLHIAIENIVGNASKYTHKNGSISIAVTPEKGFVKISIKDNGVGIARGDIKELYEKFKRIPNELSEKVGGVGLGLYWTNKIINLHGGSIGVVSELGKGTTFDIRIPKGQGNA